MKATKQYLPVVLFIMLYKVVPTFKSVDKILKCDHSSESYWAVQWNPDFSNPWFFEPPDFLNHGTFPLDLLQSKTNFIRDFWNPRFFETPDISNQFLPPMEEIYKKFTFDLSNLNEI